MASKLVSTYQDCKWLQAYPAANSGNAGRGIAEFSMTVIYNQTFTHGKQLKHLWILSLMVDGQMSNVQWRV
jgi:hypothetical protein